MTSTRVFEPVLTVCCCDPLISIQIIQFCLHCTSQHSTPQSFFICSSGQKVTHNTHRTHVHRAKKVLIASATCHRLCFPLPFYCPQSLCPIFYPSELNRREYFRLQLHFCLFFLNIGTIPSIAWGGWHGTTSSDVILSWAGLRGSCVPGSAPKVYYYHTHLEVLTSNMVPGIKVRVRNMLEMCSV